MRARTLHFEKSLLPPPRAFYEQEIGRLRRPDRKGWVRVSCPFHQPDRHPSLSVNLNSGGFLCFSCGVRGGDILDFLRQRYGISFKAAAQQLGAWNNIKPSAQEQREFAKVQTKLEQERAAAQMLVEAERRLRLEYRQMIHSMEQVCAEMQDRLHKCQLVNDEYEVCGDVLRMALDELRESTCAYFLLSFGTAAERASFVLNTESRDAAIESMMLSGTVRDDWGHRIEVSLP
jgi:hypothetical protein